jgi:denticleless
VKSFYVKLATSPCGSWLASGSSGGGVYLWDVASRSLNQRAVELKAAGREIGAVDWGSDSVGFLALGSPNQFI